jgi:F-type H+-transporting ATPase subunit b
VEIVKTTALITINETLWVQLIFFLIFLFLINRVMFRPVRRNMADREVHFLSLRQDIHLLKEEINALSDQAEAEENQLRTTAQRAGEALQEEGRKEAKQLMDKALEEIRSIQQEAEEQLKASLASARRQVEHESQGLAESIIQQFQTRRTPS